MAAGWLMRSLPNRNHGIPTAEEERRPFVFEAEVRHLITDKTVRSGEAIKQSMSQPRVRLKSRVMRRSAAGRTG